MQAITTKYLGPTNSRGARVMAKCQAKRLTLPWDYTYGIDANHAAAADALAQKLGWAGKWVGGALPDGTGNVYVCVERAFEGKFTVKGKP